MDINLFSITFVDVTVFLFAVFESVLLGKIATAYDFVQSVKILAKVANGECSIAKSAVFVTVLVGMLLLSITILLLLTAFVFPAIALIFSFLFGLVNLYFYGNYLDEQCSS